jgi:hypothetical protein
MACKSVSSRLSSLVESSRGTKWLVSTGGDSSCS